MTDNKDLKYTPPTYEQFILEESNLNQQDLYPDLDHKDIGEQRSYGPMTRGMISASVNKELNELEREIKRKREQGICTGHACQSLAEIGEYCALHKREQSEKTWVLKTTADTAASVFVPGYSAVKAMVGLASLKDELISETAQLAGAAGAYGAGISPHVGFEAAGNLSTGGGIISSGINWINHQNHVERGEKYRSDCPVCRS